MSEFQSGQFRAVILGAGFGGLRCALTLARAQDAQVCLVDQRDYQLYYPSLYRLAVPEYEKQSTKNRCCFDLREVLNATTVEFQQGEVQGVDCERQVVHLVSKSKPVELAYDYLVLALGADTDYFGVPGLADYACTFKSLEDAEFLRQKVRAFLEQVQSSAAVTRLDILVGGAGATGVELAAELARALRGMSHQLWSITLVEALGRVLWMFPEAVGQYAQERLTTLGVRIMLDTCIKQVVKPAQISAAQKFQADKIEVLLSPRPLKPGETAAALACDFLPAQEKLLSVELLLWAGGVRANPLLAHCGLSLDRKGRVEVDPTLQVQGADNIFALGDNAVLLNPATKQPVPATAQAALEQGELLARNLIRLHQKRQLRAYRFHDFAAIVPLGDRDGVALTRSGQVLRGTLAWLLRQAADLRYYFSLLPWWKALKAWL